MARASSFLLILLVGYACGIANKLFYHFDNVIYLYALNMVMVGIDTVLWFRNKKKEKAYPITARMRFLSTWPSIGP